MRIFLVLWAFCCFTSSASALEKLSLSQFENMFFHSVFSVEQDLLKQPFRQCHEQYDSLYSQSRIEISVFGGYADDENGQATDQGSIRALSRILQRPCSDDRLSLCGFQSLGTEGLRLIKSLTRQGRQVQVQVNLHFSSLTASDSSNQNSQAQEEHSERVREAFILALQESDVVLYDGHARDGGGPDFFPPRRYRNGHVNYNWYQRRRPGVKDLQIALKERQDDLFYFGFYACLTRAHFARVLRRLTPESHRGLTTRLVNEFETYEALLLSLDAILGQRCLADLETLLSPNGTVIQ